MKNRTSIEHSIFLVSKLKLLTLIIINYLNIPNNESGNNLHSEIYLWSDSF